MDKELIFTQDKINAVWSRHWRAMEGAKIKDLFESPLFIEGYKIVRSLISANAKTILDVGGGSGRYSIKLAQNFPEAKIILADIVADSFKFVRAAAEKLGVCNVETRQEDILKLSFGDNFFDAVLCDAVIQHIPDWPKATEELVRVLKPGGVLIISVNNKWNFHSLFKILMGKKYEYGFEKSFTKRELRLVVVQNGLSPVAEDGFCVAYGITRLKKYHKFFKFFGRVVNRLTKILDKLNGRFFSKHFGFQITIAAKK